MYNVHLRWATEPFYVRLFVAYLVFVILGVALLALRLALTFYSLTERIHVRPDNPPHTFIPDVLVRAAISGRLIFESVSAKCNRQEGQGRPSRDCLIHPLQLADARFQYLWQRRYTDIIWIRKLSQFTILLSIFIATYGAFPTWGDQFNNRAITGAEAFFGAASLLLERLSLGLGVGTLLYGISVSFERVALCRLALWKCLCLSCGNGFQSSK